jgi:hypothetical protein
LKSGCALVYKVLCLGHPPPTHTHNYLVGAHGGKKKLRYPTCGSSYLRDKNNGWAPLHAASDKGTLARGAADGAAAAYGATALSRAAKGHGDVALLLRARAALKVVLFCIGLPPPPYTRTSMGATCAGSSAGHDQVHPWQKWQKVDFVIRSSVCRFAQTYLGIEPRISRFLCPIDNHMMHCKVPSMP